MKINLEKVILGSIAILLTGIGILAISLSIYLFTNNPF